MLSNTMTKRTKAWKGNFRCSFTRNYGCNLTCNEKSRRITPEFRLNFAPVIFIVGQITSAIASEIRTKFALPDFCTKQVHIIQKCNPLCLWQFYVTVEISIFSALF